MPTPEKPIRQSISLPPRVARRVKALARTKKTSANRVVIDLIEAGLESQEAEKTRFFDLADQLARAPSPEEQKRLKEELARMTFGD
jgi:predicted DNA-binding protein